MPHFKLDVVYEDNHLLVLNKPAGLPTMGVAADRPSLITLAKQYVKQRYAKPGNVYLGTVSRLDAPVSGLVLFARTSKAAARLSEQFRMRAVEKIYWAIVSGRPRPGEQCIDWLAADERHRRMHLVDHTTAGALEARLQYRRMEKLAHGWLLEIELETGRKHQIRLQLSSRGLAVFGDRKYGSREAFPEGIALHARRLRFTHPTRGETVELVAPVPQSWRRFGSGGFG